MISDLQVFQMFGAMARHAAESQRVSAENIANANQPGYHAKAVESFQDFMKRTQYNPEGTATDFKIVERGGVAAPNGNTVSLEEEVFTSAEAAGQHELALSVYTKSMDLLKTALGRDRG